MEHKAAPFGGGQTAAKRLRKANILTCGIGLPVPTTNADGTPKYGTFDCPHCKREGLPQQRKGQHICERERCQSAEHVIRAKQKRRARKAHV